MKDTVRTAVLNLFSGSVFCRSWESNWLFYGTVEGIIIGVVIATYNFKYNASTSTSASSVLNSGKIHEAYVVTTKGRICVDAAEARKVWARLKDVEPIEGRFGPFWAIPGLSDDGDPFAGPM